MKTKLSENRPQNKLPFFRFAKYVKVVYFPIFKGSFLGALPCLTCLCLGKVQFTESLFGYQIVFPNWDVSEIDSEGELLTIYGRAGFMFFSLGLMLVFMGAGLMIPKPKMEEEKLIINNMLKDKYLKKQLSEKKERQETYMDDDGEKDSWHSATEQELLNLINEKNQNNSDDDLASENNDNLLRSSRRAEKNQRNGEKKKRKNINFTAIDQDTSKEKVFNTTAEIQKFPDSSPILVLTFKRRIYFMTCFFCGLVNLYPLSLAFKDFFKDNIYLNIIIFLLQDILVIWAGKNYLIKEMLLVAPILTGYEFIQLMVLHGAKDMTTFIIANVFRVICVALARIFQDPTIHNLQIYKKKMHKWLLRKAEDDEFYDKFLKLFENDDVGDKAYYFQTDTLLDIDDEVQVESLLLSQLSFTCKATVNPLRPITLLFIFLYTDESKLNSAEKLNNDSSNILYYMLIELGIIGITILVDTIILYVIEVIWKFKIYDYLYYCNYRFKNRNAGWIFGSTINNDISLETKYRSMDSLHFSDQYYYLVTFQSMAIILVTFGTYIMTLNNYIMFNDPYALVMIPMSFVIIQIFKLLSFILNNIFKFWKLPPPREKKNFQINFELDNYAQKNIDIYNDDSVRIRFMQKNKEWIQKRLKHILEYKDFKANNGQLIKIYKNQDDIAKKEQIEIVRKELIEKNKFYPKIRKKDEQKNAVVVSTKPEFIKVVVLLQYWHILAREAHFYRDKIKDISLLKKIMRFQNIIF